MLCACVAVAVIVAAKLGSLLTTRLTAIANPLYVKSPKELVKIYVSL